MNKPIISLIAAVSRNGFIGKDGALPWKLPADLAYFRSKTSGKPVIMGRKTYESIGRPLTNRVNIIMTRNADFIAQGCVVVQNIDDALKACNDAAEVMVIGGAEIYSLFLPIADRLYMTEVEVSVDGDTLFPDYNRAEWRISEASAHEADDKNPYNYTFKIYKRRP